MQSAGHIIKAPWVDDEIARLVKSSSGPQPHLVTRDPMFLSMITAVQCSDLLVFVHM